jgi:hypothetical protein
MDVEAKKAYAEARRMDRHKYRASRLSGIDDDTSAWFMKRGAEIRARDA